jgi:hypothetical protein
MTRPFRPLHSRLSVPAALMLAACLGTASAQEPPATTTSSPAQGRARPATAQGGGPMEIERPLLSVEFKGGTVTEFVEVVKDASPVPVNVVGPAEAMKMPVPAVSLRNVTPFMALQTLEYVNERRPSVSVPGGMASMLQVLDLNRSEPNNTRSQTFAISLGRNQQFQIGAQGPIMGPAAEVAATQVYAVRDLLGGDAGGLPGLSMEQIVEPLEAALNVDAGDGSGEPAKLMVHKASNLILVRGTARQNALVRQVLDRLREDTLATRASSGREREQARITEELQKQYQVRQRMLEMQTVEQEKRLDELRAVLAKAHKDKQDDQAATFTDAIREAEASLSTLQKQMSQNKMQMAEVPFEASRQARVMSSGSAELAAQLRAEIDSLRKQIEDLRAATRPGPK